MVRLCRTRLTWNGIPQWISSSDLHPRGELGPGRGILNGFAVSPLEEVPRFGSRVHPGREGCRRAVGLLLPRAGLRPLA